MIVDHCTDNMKIGQLAEFLNLYETECLPLQSKHAGAAASGAGMILLPDFRD